MYFLDDSDKEALAGVRRLGIYGGSFNPPHSGHLHVARVAKKELGLDSLWWLLAPHSGFKQGLAPVEIRQKAILDLISKEAGMHLSMAEVKWDFSYTKDTLSVLKEVLPKDIVYYLILGEDSWQAIHKWKDYRYILNNIPIAVVKRKTGRVSFFKEVFSRRSVSYMRSNKVKAPAWCLLKSDYNLESSTRIRGLTPNKSWWQD